MSHRITEAEAQRLQAMARGAREKAAAKGNKFHAKPETIGGIRYGSKREAARAAELQWMEQAGLITDLVLDKRQLRYDLIVNGVKVGSYTADASYREHGMLVVEDVKSGPTRTREYRRNKKWMLALYGISIREID